MVANLPPGTIIRFRWTTAHLALIGVANLLAVLDEIDRRAGLDEAGQAQVVAIDRLREGLGHFIAGVDDYERILENFPVLEALLAQAEAATEAGIGLDALINLAADGSSPGGARSDG